MPLPEKIIRFVKGKFQHTKGLVARRWHLRRSVASQVHIGRDDWEMSVRDPLAFYLRCFRLFHKCFPAPLREHRSYFTRHGRGFGEDAFHVMWFLLFNELKPSNFLEIGVYRGQTISLLALLAKISASRCDVYGISPFSSAADAVSRYREGIAYFEDTLTNFERFALPPPHLLKAYSTDSSALALIQSRAWSAIYIDGNHDYEIVSRDWKACAANIAPGGIIVLDDSGLTTSYKPPNFATAGHPGPSKVAAEIDRSQFQEILQVGHNRVFQKLA